MVKVPKKILIMSAWCGIGDLYLFLPALRSIKEKWGEYSEIHICIDPVRWGLKHDLIWGQPDIDKVIKQKGRHDSIREPIYDVVYETRGGGIELPFRYINDDCHYFDYIKRIYDLNMWDNYPPKIYYSEEEESQIENFMQRFDYPVLIHTLHTNRWPYGKALPQTFWEWLIPQYPNIQFLQVGVEEIDYDLNSFPNVIDLKGKLKIRLSALLMKHVKFHICVESIMAHISATTQKKGVVVWGISPHNYLEHKHNINLHNKLDCSPCIKYELTGGRDCCQKDGVIYPWDEIKDAIDGLIEEIH